jgi:hypothetical protein
MFESITYKNMTKLLPLSKPAGRQRNVTIAMIGLFTSSIEVATNLGVMGEKRKAYRLLVGKPEGKRPLGRPRRRRVDNIRMDPGEVGWGDVDWIRLAKDINRWRALVNSVLNLRAP